MIDNLFMINEHIGHKIVCVNYELENEIISAIECETCNIVLLQKEFIGPTSDEIEQLELVTCEHCNWSGPTIEIIKLDEIPLLASYLIPGDEIPVGACPDCGKFFYYDLRPEDECEEERYNAFDNE